jgi:hypothetical protein
MYRSEDEPALKQMHGAQGFGYTFPELTNPLFVSKVVLEDDDGRPMMAALGRVTCEVYLLADPKAGTPRERFQRLLVMHEASRRDLEARGFDDATCWVPAQIAKAFSRRLERLGWVRDPWPSYSRRTAP